MKDNTAQQKTHLHANIQGSSSILPAKNPRKVKQFFKKQSYTFRTFIRDLSLILLNIHNIRTTMHSRRISSRFAEHIMLVITSVNDCVYCSWAHVNMALEVGCTEEEVSSILALDFKELPREELVALVFAQHYAETAGNPSRQSLQKLITQYGLEKSKDILNYIKMITLANLMGNTLSAFESRLKGIPPEKGSPLLEFLVFTFGGFFLAKKYANAVKN